MNMNEDSLNGNVLNAHVLAIIEVCKKTSKHLKIHKLVLPDFKEKGSHQQGISFSAFFSYKKKRNENDNVTFCKKFWFDYLQDIDSFKKFCESRNLDIEIQTHENTPFVEHRSLWDFYKSIGYDYKKKKFIS
jgi:hypothetical protein